MKKLLTVGLFLSLSIGSAQAFTQQVPNVRDKPFGSMAGQNPPIWEQPRTGPLFGGQRPTFGELAISRMNLSQVKKRLNTNSAKLKEINRQISDLKKAVRKNPDMQGKLNILKQQQEQLNATKAALQQRMKAVK